MLLFLGGLFAFWRSLDGEAPAPQLPPQIQSGLLWGASFLCRVDCMYLVLILLLLCFTALPALAQRWRAWMPLVRIVLVFAFLAGVYQFAGGEYVSLFSDRNVLKAGPLTDLGLEIVTTASSLVRSHPLIAAIIFLILTAMIVFVPIPQRKEKASEESLSWLRVAAGILVAVVMLAPITGFPPRLKDFVLHVRWFLPYAPPLLLALLAAGTAFLCISDRRPSYRVLTLLMILACTMYIFRPLIYPEQPWAMRRFVPCTDPGLLLVRRYWVEPAAGNRCTKAAGESSGHSNCHRVGCVCSLAKIQVSIHRTDVSGCALAS